MLQHTYSSWGWDSFLSCYISFIVCTYRINGAPTPIWNQLIYYMGATNFANTKSWSKNLIGTKFQPSVYNFKNTNKFANFQHFHAIFWLPTLSTPISKFQHFCPICQPARFLVCLMNQLFGCDGAWRSVTGSVEVTGGPDPIRACLKHKVVSFWGAKDGILVSTRPFTS